MSDGRVLTLSIVWYNVWPSIDQRVECSTSSSLFTFCQSGGEDGVSWYNGLNALGKW